VRDALLTLKARYKRRKLENLILKEQLTAFRKLVTSQCIIIKEGREEISRLEGILFIYYEAEEAEEANLYSTFGWRVESSEVEDIWVDDSGLGSSQ
jgi:hypothetical protein